MNICEGIPRLYTRLTGTKHYILTDLSESIKWLTNCIEVTGFKYTNIRDSVNI